MTNALLSLLCVAPLALVLVDLLVQSRVESTRAWGWLLPSRSRH